MKPEMQDIEHLIRMSARARQVLVECNRALAAQRPLFTETEETNELRDWYSVTGRA